MGCTQSKIENEEAVSRCKERKQFMSKAVSSRNAFAAAHFAYTIALKNTGAALNDYCQGEVQHILPPSTSTHPSSSSTSTSTSIPSSAAAAAAIQPPIDKPLPPPPPPLPNSEFPSVPLQRAASMPEIPLPISKKHPANAAIREEDEDKDDDDDDDDDGIALEHHRDSVGAAERSSTPPPPPQANSVPLAPPAETSGSGKTPVWLSDYFFNTEDIPVPSLSQPDEVPVATTSGGGDNDDDLPAVLPEKVVTEPPSPPPQQPKPVKKQKPVHHQYGASAGASESKRGRIVAATAQSVNLLKIFTELDDHFLKASESAHEVSKMLEATRMHYHSNFADNRGHIDHSARVMRVITWNRSFKGVPIADDEKNADDGKDDFDNDESETHATVLDKMLAWEKKLYDEVKAGELMKIECQRKVALLNKQKKRGASPETLEKTKAALSHLHTRYIVDMQSMDSTVSEINRLRDKQLYPKLVDLVDGMAKMWETMYGHHRSQRKIIADLKNLDVSLAPKETSEQHHERTIQLCHILEGWHSHFQKVVSHQKEYIQALNSWLKLNLIPIESSLKEKVSSPPRVLRPPIQPLLHAWHELLEKLPYELAKNVIHSFSEVVHTIMIIQEDELKLKERCEETRRDYMRKRRAFEDWYHKYSQKRGAAAAAAAKEAAATVADPESSEAANQNDLVAERKVVVESLRMRLTDDEEAYQRICKQVREKSVGSLRTHLPELFRAMSDFALGCFEMYKKLNSITTKSQETVASN